MHIVIRRATLEDAPAIYRVHLASIQTAASHYSPPQLAAWSGSCDPSSYAGPIEHKVVFVAEQSSVIQGFGQLDPQARVVDAVYVAPDIMRKGIGSSLLSALEAHAKSLGIEQLTLDASLSAMAFFIRAGYTLVAAANHDLGNGVSIPCIAMRKALSLR